MQTGIMTIKGDLRLKTLAGTVRYVGPNCSYTTITGALADCTSGDTILVAPGTYTEAITYTANNLSIVGLGGKGNCTITKTAAAVVTCNYSNCRIEGFTITADSDQYGLYFSGSNNEIINCDDSIGNTYAAGCSIRNCALKFIYVYGGTTKIIHCNIVYSSDGGTNNVVVRGNTTICEIWDSYMSSTSTAAGANVSACNVAGGESTTTTTVRVYNTYLYARWEGSSGSSTYGAWNVDNRTTNSFIGLYNCIYNISSTAGSAAVFRLASFGTREIYGGDIVQGDIGAVGTNYGVAKAGDAGFGVVSPATTGGTGTAGSGNQYVELEINGVVYKILHDGTV